MNVRSIASSPRRNALREHFQDGIEGLTPQVAIGVRTSEQFEELVLTPLFGCAGSHDLLRQHIQRRLRNHEPIQIAMPDRQHQCRALQ